MHCMILCVCKHIYMHTHIHRGIGTVGKAAALQVVFVLFILKKTSLLTFTSMDFHIKKKYIYSSKKRNQ